MWSTVVARDLFAGLPYYDFSLKPLFNLLLWANFKVAEQVDLHPMVLARGWFVGNVFVVLVLFYRLARRLSASPGFALMLTALLASNSFFIKRFANVRSDILASTLILVLFNFEISGRWTRLKSGSRVLVYCLLLAVAALVTPKAVFPVGLWGLIFGWRDLRAIFQKRRGLFGILILAILAVLFALRNWHATQFFLNSFAGTGELSYWSTIRFEHVLRCLRENLFFSGLLLVNLIVSLRNRARVSAATLRYFDYANSLLVLLAFYPDRLPFFIASLLPYFYLPAAAVWPQIIKSSYFRRYEWKRSIVMLSVFCAGTIFYWCAFLIFHHNSQNQRQYIAWLAEQPLKDLKIYDSVGVLPFVPHTYLWFLGPGEAGNHLVFDAIRNNSIDVIPYTARLLYLGPNLWNYLRQYYGTDQAGLFVRKREFAFKSHKVNAGDLKKRLSEAFPQFVDSPRKLFVQIKTKDGVDLTRFVHWKDKNGHEVEFAPELSLAELDKHKELILPPTIKMIAVFPVHLATPSDLNWINLFRFDSEI